MPAMIDMATAYGESRLRLSELVRALPQDPKSIPVECCPGWSVHDVVSHLAAVAEDVLAGRLAGPPPDEVTAAQVARRAELSTAQVLDDWAGYDPGIRELLAGIPVWPLMMDALSHEHDVRAAVGAPGARDLPEIAASAQTMVERLGDEQLAVVMGGRTYGDLGAGLTLRTSSWEAFRFRLGRRSRRQLAAMDWSGDPSPVLDRLAVFGPSPVDIIE